MVPVRFLGLAVGALLLLLLMMSTSGKLVSCPCPFCAPEGRQVTPYIRRQHSRRYCERRSTSVCGLRPPCSVTEDQTGHGQAVDEDTHRPSADEHDDMDIDQQMQTLEPGQVQIHVSDSDSASTSNQEILGHEVGSSFKVQYQNKLILWFVYMQESSEEDLVSELEVTQGGQVVSPNDPEDVVLGAEYDLALYESESATTPLYPGASITLLNTIVQFFLWFTQHPSISKDVLSDLLNFQHHSVLPDGNLLPDSYDKALKLVEPFLINPSFPLLS